jgi:hypothetical protein
VFIPLPFAKHTNPYLTGGLRDIKMPHTISRKKNIYQLDKRLINLSRGESKLCVVHFLKAEKKQIKNQVSPK